MSAFDGIKPCQCGESPVLCWERGTVFFEPSCRNCKVKVKPVRQGDGAGDRARENWNRSMG